MTRFLLSRLALLVPTLLGVLAVTFLGNATNDNFSRQGRYRAILLDEGFEQLLLGDVAGANEELA